MVLYSLRGQYPQQLPDRILLSDGFTRTGGNYTDEEIADAGYFAVEVPNYDPNTHQLSWNGLEFSLELIPPPTPTPDWVKFSQSMIGDIQFNGFYKELSIANPLVASSIQVALLNASLGRTDAFDAFALIWGLISSNIAPEHKNQWAGYAQVCDLPSDFIEILLS
jgi:hypothetical protein